MNKLLAWTKEKWHRLDGKLETKHWGQHFLVDEKVRNQLVEQVPLMPVVEIGPGLGALTEPLARRALPMAAIEIDRRFEPVLQPLQAKYPHLKVIFANALRVDFFQLAKEMGKEQIWLAGNLPYQLLEPLLLKLIRQRRGKEIVAGATFLISQRSAWEMVKDRPPRTKLGLLAASLFDGYLAKEKIGRESFWPQPRTQSAIIHLERRDKRALAAQPVDFIWRYLFGHPRARVENALREAFIALDYARSQMEGDKKIAHRREPEKFLTKNRSRELVRQLKLPARLGELPVEQLGNMELEDLDRALFELVDYS